MKIKIKDINGNWVWYDTETKLTTSAEVLLGTIRNNAVKSVGADTSTKKGRVMAAHNQTQSYNRRLHKVHNYADQTTRLKLKQLTVSVDKLGEPTINQTDYTPNVEAPMIPYTPLEEMYVGTKVLDLPFKFGSKAVQYGLGKYGSKFGWDELLLSARNKILSDVFDRLSLRLKTPQATTPNEEGALIFFQRNPSKISISERKGVLKDERNLLKNGNVASMTPEQWTAAQDAAIARGDMVEAQRLRDLHSALVPSTTPGKYYRGTQTKRTSYPDRHIDKEVGEMNGIYMTKNPKYAKTYGDVEEFYLHSNNPLNTEGSWTGVIDDATRIKIENSGYDAVVNNRFDTGFLNKLLRNSRDETITFNGKNIKSADAVTYDNNGVRIPLGERDNFNINDIRYGFIPLSVGYTLYNQPQYWKQGGKMNTLLFLKDGGIHIKKKNKGLFTDYCNGKVTLECINRGKHSSNPITRKRATFADNVRHFNHKLGSKLNKFQQGGSFNLVEYIKAIENPNKIGWNGEVWVAPPEGKGYDPNLRGYGIDVEYNVAAKKLTEGRKGRYLTDEEMTNLMNLHLDYVRGVANRRIEGFNKLSPARLGVLLGMLYRGDSIKGINVNEPNDLKFFNQIHDYYKKAGVAERAKLSNNYLLAHNNYLSTKNPKIIINLNNAPMLNTDNTSVVKPTYLPIENRKARYPTKKGSYVETMTRGENFIENLKEKVRVENLMDNLKPKIKKSYKFPISFNKKGGIVKASTGTSLFRNISNFLKSDAGKSIINGITSIGSAIKSNNLLGDAANLAKSGVDFETKLKKAQAHNYGYNRALDYIRNIQDPNNPNAFGGDIFLNHFANLMANQFTLGYDEEAEAKKLLIDLQMKLLQVDTMSGAINSFADAGMNMLLNLLNKPKFDNSKNNYSVSNSGNKSTITTNIGGISTSNTYNIPTIKFPTIKSNF